MRDDVRSVVRTPPPRLAMATGALAVSSSAIFIDLSGVLPGTASFFRCLLALTIDRERPELPTWWPCRS